MIQLAFSWHQITTQQQQFSQGNQTQPQQTQPNQPQTPQPQWNASTLQSRLSVQQQNPMLNAQLQVQVSKIEIAFGITKCHVSNVFLIGLKCHLYSKVVATVMRPDSTKHNDSVRSIHQ